MAKNIVYKPGDHLSVPVPAGTKSGDPVRVGGLNGVAITDRANTGVSPVNATPNAGKLAITLKPREGRADRVEAIIERLKTAVADIPGMTVYFQPVQDIQISTRSSRSQYQYTLTGANATVLSGWT